MDEMPTPGTISMRAATEYTTPQPVSSTYQSNPFLVVAKGIVTILQTNPGTALVMALVLALIAAVGITFLVLVGIIAHSTVATAIILIVGLLAYLAFLAISVGSYLSLGSASTRHERISVSQALKQATHKLLPLIAVSILGGLVVMIGFILLVIPGVILLGRLSLALVVMMEENLGVMASLKRSWALTRHHTIEMLGALFASSFMSGGGLIAPTVNIAPLFGRYDDLIALERSGQAKPPIHWLNYLAFLAVLPVIAMSVVLILLGNGTIKTPNSNTNINMNMNQDQIMQMPANGTTNGSDNSGFGSSDNSGMGSTGSGFSSGGSTLNNSDTFNQ